MSESLNFNDTGESKALRTSSALALSSDLCDFTVPTQHKARLANDSARYKANGFLPADFQITGLTDSKAPRQKCTVFEQRALQAVEPMPPLSETLKLSPYDSSIKLNVQITNVPEVSQVLTGYGLLNYFSTATQVGAITTSESALQVAEHLAQPNAVNNDLINLAKHYAQGTDQFNKDVQLFAGTAMQQAQRIFEQMDKPMTPKQRALMAGAILPLFFMDGKAMEPKATEQMGLADMSAEELDKLRIKRVEVPLKLERDGFSIKASIPGDPKAFVEANVPSPGVVDVTYINRGNLPKGMGGNLLAQTLQGHGALPTHRLVFSGIINPETLDQFAHGVAPEATLLGKSGAKAMRALGIEPTRNKFEMVRGKLNLVIEAK